MVKIKQIPIFVSKAKRVKPFRFVSSVPIPQSKNTPQQKADKLNTQKILTLIRKEMTLQIDSNLYSQLNHSHQCERYLTDVPLSLAT